MQSDYSSSIVVEGVMEKVYEKKKKKFEQPFPSTSFFPCEYIGDAFHSFLFPERKRSNVSPLPLLRRIATVSTEEGTEKGKRSSLPLPSREITRETKCL